MRVLQGIALGVAGVAALLFLAAFAGRAWLDSSADQALPWDGGEVTATPRPARAAAAAGDKQILFGDLHVHTMFSADAFSYTLPIYQGTGARPPADACDFARFCSQLDFWSINDHAESLGTRQWSETVRAIRQCNAAAGDPASPDLVSFLGWEWSQGTVGGGAHYGHKNVVLLHESDGRVPDRPVAAGTLNPLIHLGVALGTTLTGDFRADDLRGLHRFVRESIDRTACPEGVDVRALPEGCTDVAPSPDVLFEKLSQWGEPAIVIPHGLAWGITNPKGATLEDQLAAPMHDPQWQRLIEIYSGHGNSEVFADFERGRMGEDGDTICPAPTDRFEPCCHRAGVLARAQCADPASEACAQTVEEVRARVVRESSSLTSRFGGQRDWVPGVPDEAYGDCDQLQGGFLSAYGYEPRMSTQFGYAGGPVSESEAPAYWRLGVIGSSDNHSARPGTGFKEFARLENTEGYARTGPESVSGSYFFTGGLAAVHAAGRDREAVFDALHRREVYGTSGDRILLWFDAIGADEERWPMGSQNVEVAVPRFEVRALGAFEQKPGCPAFVRDALPPERLSWLCMDECFHPSDVRKPITRIEVVRIRPRTQEGATAAAAIDDPWRTFACPADGAGCRVAFEDTEPLGQETLYYVRAIQTPSPAVNGDPLQCERDESGRCLRATRCPGTGRAGDPPAEDCLAPVEERAWSSPIWLRPPAAARSFPSAV